MFLSSINPRCCNTPAVLAESFIRCSNIPGGGRLAVETFVFDQWIYSKTYILSIYLYFMSHSLKASYKSVLPLVGYEIENV